MKINNIDAILLGLVGDEGLQQFPKFPHETHVLGRTAGVDSKRGICAPPEGNASPGTLADTGQDQGQSAIAGAVTSRDIPQASATVAPTIAALFVETDGSYYGLPGVDPWDEARDARTYAGPYPVVAHPPCQRWGRFWHGSTRKPHQFELGDDSGCFRSALEAVRKFGGVLEHPADSKAWKAFGLAAPKRGSGWAQADSMGGWTCYVEQGHYGHLSRKPTWLYVVNVERRELEWSRLPQRLHPVALERYGYEKARRIGMMAMIGGKEKTRIRNATPTPFRDLLISIARTARPFPATHQP